MAKGSAANMEKVHDRSDGLLSTEESQEDDGQKETGWPPGRLVCYLLRML